MYGLNNNTGLKYTDNNTTRRLIHSTEFGEKLKKVSENFNTIKDAINGIEQIKNGQTGFDRAKGIANIVASFMGKK